MIFRSMLGAALAAFLFASPASATIIDLGTIGAGDTLTSIQFENQDLADTDQVHFNVTSTFDFAGFVQDIEFATVSALALVDLGTMTTLASGLPASLVFSPIGPGDYSFDITREFDVNQPEGAFIGVRINLTATTTSTPIPEPATALMFALGLGGLAAARRSSRKG